MFALVENNVIVEWPVLNPQRRFPNISFPTVITDNNLPDGLVSVRIGEAPVITNPATEKLVLSETPTFDNGVWTLTYSIVPMTAQEISQYQEQLYQSIVESTQVRLDKFARTKGYDGIMSACTYATSTDSTFAAEGQRAVDLRDQTWRTLYNLLGEVQAGTRPIPSGFGDIESLLPTLSWT